mmetsp:Transcript_5618/g.13470  ORF Transcript_5618/g.13470 Transcript_5618/m.13470 type:complete len:209 (-) Transcript_5618:40-666(-)
MLDPPTHGRAEARLDPSQKDFPARLLQPAALPCHLCPPRPRPGHVPVLPHGDHLFSDPPEPPALPCTLHPPRPCSRHAPVFPSVQNLGRDPAQPHDLVYRTGPLSPHGCYHAVLPTLEQARADIPLTSQRVSPLFPSEEPPRQLAMPPSTRHLLQNGRATLLLCQISCPFGESPEQLPLSPTAHHLAKDDRASLLLDSSRHPSHESPR